MSSNYYFHTWREALDRLEKLVQLDIEYQETKIHDKTQCDAVTRLTGVLGRYMQLYNDTLECVQQNLQVQKTKHMVDVNKAICSRIRELKHQLYKLECSNIEFLSQGLANNKLTTKNAELTEVYIGVGRSEDVKLLIAEAFKKAREERRALAIRQVTQHYTKLRQRREMWVKKIAGTLRPQASFELKTRSAKLIQMAIRKYFEIKRARIKQCKEDEMLGINPKINKDASTMAYKIKNQRAERRKTYEQEWIQSYNETKEKIIERYKIVLAEDYRDFIREWFRTWFDDIKYFHDVPKPIEGGSVKIMKGDIPEPLEWWEEYQKFLEEKKANKNTSALQRKWAEKEAKREETLRKKEEHMKQKMQADLLKKIMKNPMSHPGFHYPKSKKTGHISDVIKAYQHYWGELDSNETADVKKKYVQDVDVSNAFADAKREIMQSVDDDMRQELKILKKALKTDYLNNEEKMPEPMKPQKRRKNKKKRKVRRAPSEHFAQKLEDLAFKGVLKEYPRTELRDFLGDHNYTGDDTRCQYRQAHAFNGELRAIWWERSQDVNRGFHRILLVGPRSSGKTVLVHALASLNDAVLFELNPTEIDKLSPTAADLKSLMTAVVTCAKASQPTVIHIKHIHRFYYKKIPLTETITNLNLMRKYLLKKLCKSFHKTDSVTVIGTCIDPWQTKAKNLLKSFSSMVLIPKTSYSATRELLQNWINNNHPIPRHLEVSSLAYMLRGYSYGCLQESLTHFLTEERIVKIAAHGLSPDEIYNHFLENYEQNSFVDYEKYLKWYYDRTQWGKKEMRHVEEQRDFARALQVYAARVMKKKKAASAVSSLATLPRL